MRRPRSISTESNESLQKHAAYLRVRKRFTQMQISDSLGISQAEVSRLLRKAKDERILVSEPVLNLPDDEITSLERQYGWGEVEKSLRNLLPVRLNQSFRFHIQVHSGAFPDFTDTAAARVLHLLSASYKVGLMWGRTVHEIVNGIERRCTPARPILRTEASLTAETGRDEPYCIPLCGDPVHLMNQNEVDFSASHLGAKLAGLHTGRPSQRPYSLTGIPAYVPKDLLDLKPFQKFLRSVPGYSMILDDEKGLKRSVDTVLSGIGIIARESEPEHATAAFIRERLLLGEVSRKDLRRLIVGDIGGILLERPDLKAHELKKVEALNAGWTGVAISDLEAVANRARDQGSPGMILVAYGEAKAELFCEIVRRGLVNEGIIDASLAEKVRAIINS
jgi:DNA-binding transcriptional regulator LsrR (DeoR family)